MRALLRSRFIVPALLLCAVAFLLAINLARARRVTHVSELAGGAAVTADRASTSGYAGGVRVLIAPERNAESYQWILQTQQMLATGEWRVRAVAYDNAPQGREVHSASVYRWWFGLLAWIDQSLSTRSLARAVEHAALWVDPALHLVLLVAAAVFVAWQFGWVAAGWLGLGIAGLFPFAGAFLPGQPGDQGLIQAAVLWSVLPLLVGVRAAAGLAGSDPGDAASASAPRPRQVARRWFAVAGAAGGLSLWISVAAMLPVLLGIALGGLAAAALTRRDPGPRGEMNDLPWHAWALGGAVAVLVAYVLEYAPDAMGTWRVSTVHPLHGVAWLGLGALLMFVEGWLRRGRPAWSWRRLTAIALAAAAMLALPAMMIWGAGPGVFTPGALSERLSKLPHAPIASDLAAWLGRDGVTAVALVTLLPLALIALAGWLLHRARKSGGDPRLLVVALGPVAIAGSIAMARLGNWGVLDSTLLALSVPVTGALTLRGVAPLLRWSSAGVAAVTLFIGARLLVPPAAGPEGYDVTPSEVEALIERDLTHWLARRAGRDAIVFAPPQLTASCIFHGGLRGLGTPYPENREGFAAAVRIASATSIDETLALVQRRGITHIVMPSWDPFLDEYARLGAGQPENSFIGLLHKWLPPRWLRPVAYQMPQIPGFEGQTVEVFEVVDLQDNVVALSRLVEYFVETGRLELALSASYALREEFGDDLGASVARAHAEAAVGGAGFRDVLAKVQSQLAAGADKYLPWDRRVSLALLLAQARQFEAARAQAERSIVEMDEPKLRSLSTITLYRWLRLQRALQLQPAEPRLRELARELLSPELRETL